MLIRAADSHPRVTRHDSDAPADAGIESGMTPRLPLGDHLCVDADGAAPAVPAVPEGSEEGWGTGGGISSRAETSSDKCLQINTHGHIVLESHSTTRRFYLRLETEIEACSKRTAQDLHCESESKVVFAAKLQFGSFSKQTWVL